MGRIMETCVLLAAWICVSQATHFRGASITWRPVGNKVQIDYRISWRSSERHHHCNKTKIANGSDNSEYNMRFISSTDPAYKPMEVIAPMAYHCTDFSVGQGWTTGRGHSNFTYISGQYYEFGFLGCCWITELNHVTGGMWALRAVANMTVRSDTGRINSSPTVDIPPIIALQHGCTEHIVIPVSDPDGDIVRCRWSVTSAECGDVCNGLPHSILQDSCTISYAAVYQTGWFVVAVQIEDYPRDNSSHTPFSSVPLQFMVYVENRTCDTQNHEKPKFVELTLPDQACVGVANGTELTADIAIVSQANRSISEVNTISPLGLMKSALQRNNFTGVWHVKVTWKPSTGVINNVFCFTAVDDSGLSSQRRCITLLAGVPPPVAIHSTRHPATQGVQTGQRQWSIEFNQYVTRAQRSANIYLYSAAPTTLLEIINVYNDSHVTTSRGSSGTVLHFRTSTALQAGKTYYFLFGHGLVDGTTYCGAGSSIVRDPYFWRFTAINKVNWNIANPCANASLHAGNTKFPHPSDHTMFIMCDLSGKMYLSHCPPGEVFHPTCRECADPIVTITCGRVLPSAIADPCTPYAITAGHVSFPYPGNVTKYIHCDSWGHPWARDCQAGQHWDVGHEICLA